MAARVEMEEQFTSFMISGVLRTEGHSKQSRLMLMVSRLVPGAGSSRRMNEPPGGDVMPNSFCASSIKSFSLIDLG